MQSPHSKEVHRALISMRENMAQEFVRGLNRSAFETDARTVYAVTRCLEIVSEASRRLGDQIESRNPHLPWAQIRASGNFYRHRYDNVSPGVLWTTVTVALPELALVVDAEIAAMEDPAG
jgi:uncharacterized protein with HEPN domain